MNVLIVEWNDKKKPTYNQQVFKTISTGGVKEVGQEGETLEFDKVYILVRRSETDKAKSSIADLKGAQSVEYKNSNTLSRKVIEIAESHSQDNLYYLPIPRLDVPLLRLEAQYIFDNSYLTSAKELSGVLNKSSGMELVAQSQTAYSISLFIALVARSLLRTKTKQRIICSEMFRLYSKTKYPILLLGERGTGKTSLVSERFDKAGDNAMVVHKVNCASFDDTAMAESHLFGHVKGGFTDAKSKRLGAFVSANNGVLFLDEVHHLPKRVQAKLMSSVQAKEGNIYSVIPLGADEPTDVSLTIIYASNKSLTELQSLLLPDFYDRISRQIIELPPLRDCREDIESDWILVCERLGIDDEIPYSDDYTKMFNWIKQQPLKGNYRDLERVVLLYHCATTMDKKLKELQGIKSPYDYVTREYPRQVIVEDDNESVDQISVSILDDKAPLELVSDFKRNCITYIEKRFGSIDTAVEFYKSKGLGCTRSTLYKWK